MPPLLSASVVTVSSTHSSFNFAFALLRFLTAAGCLLKLPLLYGLSHVLLAIPASDVSGLTAHRFASHCFLVLFCFATYSECQNCSGNLMDFFSAPVLHDKWECVKYIKASCAIPIKCLKIRTWGWNLSLTIKSMACSSRGPKFGF